jgi:hypothetical protein
VKNERLLVGIAARMMNCEIILCGIGPRSLSIYGFWVRVPMYVYFLGQGAYVSMILGQRAYVILFRLECSV